MLKMSVSETVFKQKAKVALDILVLEWTHTCYKGEKYAETVIVLSEGLSETICQLPGIRTRKM